MIKTTLPTKRAISDIVKTYRHLQRRRLHPLSLRDFSNALTELLTPIGGSISHQSIMNWENMVHLPHPFYMKQMASQARECWQQDFAKDVLAVLQPHEYKPATRAGKSAVKWIKREYYAKHLNTGRQTGPGVGG